MPSASRKRGFFGSSPERKRRHAGARDATSQPKHSISTDCRDSSADRPLYSRRRARAVRAAAQRGSVAASARLSARSPRNLTRWATWLPIVLGHVEVGELLREAGVVPAAADLVE